MITQEQLEAVADALASEAQKHGVGGFVTRDQEIEIAAAVIKAYQATLQTEPPKGE